MTQEDNEYKWAGVADPKIVITTSRKPSSSLQKFAKVSLMIHSQDDYHLLDLAIYICDYQVFFKKNVFF